MTTESPTASRDALLVQVLDGYLSACRRGERPDSSDLVARHPEIASELRTCLASLEFIQQAEQSAGFQDLAGEAAAAAGNGTAMPAGPTLGDFRIVRQIGRGGMGVVYEAEQISLHRRVALKTLPFAGVLDQRQLARFKNEALAAAALQHPNIVPVYAVGCERGVHYYAMQYIAGQNLAELITEMRVREGLAKPGEAEETEAAGTRTGDRGRGTGEGAAVISTLAGPKSSSTQPTKKERQAYYREVARIGKEVAEALSHAHAEGVIHRDIKPSNLLLDAAGKIWITDFGLAQTRSDSSLTITGDLVGTLRYMSPEQALGKREPIDHRTDIYSLGATLYEMLTLRPVIPGKNREELLRNIGERDPVAPRRARPDIPRDLETITLKMLSQTPEDRYATAGHLADDLRRFLKAQPIAARPPGTLSSVARWARRHRRIVAATVMLLVVATIAMAGVSVRMSQLRNLAVATAQREEVERLRAAENFRKALDAISRMNSVPRDPDRINSLVKRDKAAGPPTLVEFRQALRATSIELLEEYLSQPANSVNAQQERGWAWLALAATYKGSDEFPQSHQACIEAATIFEKLFKQFPDRADFAYDLAVAHVALHQKEEALAARPSAVRSDLERAYQILEDLIDQYPTQTKYRLQRVTCLSYLTGTHQHDEQALLRDLARWNDLLDREPPTRQIPGHIASVYRALAGLHARNHRLERVNYYTDQWLDRLRSDPRLTTESEFGYQVLSHFGELVSYFEEKQHNYDLAIEYWRKAIELTQGHVRPERHLETLARLAELQEDAGRYADASDTHLKILEQSRFDRESDETLAKRRLEFADFLRHTGAFGDAAREYLESESLLKGAKTFPPNFYYKMAISLAESGRHAEALPVMDRYAGLEFGNAEFGSDRRLLRAKGHFDLAQIFLLAGKSDLARTTSDLATAAMDSLEQNPPASNSILMSDLGTLCSVSRAELPSALAIVWCRLGLVRAQLGEMDQAKRCWEGAGRADPSARYWDHFGFFHERNELAWRLATCPYPEGQNPELAVKLAQADTRSRLGENDAEKWNTLGVALFRQGDWSNSIEALERSVGLSKGGSAFDMFFLAMNRWQLGDQERAHQEFQRAIQQMEQSPPASQPAREELARFHKEAATLLKLNEAEAP